MSSRIYKVVLIGDAGVGKTTFLKMLDGGGFEKKYIPTIGCDVRSVDVNTTDGRSVIFNVWDCAGQEKFGGLADGYYLQADCAIIMCDDKDITLRNAFNKWIPGLIKAVGQIPMELVINKCDLKEREGVLNISAKNNTPAEIKEVFRKLLAKFA